VRKIDFTEGKQKIFALELFKGIHEVSSATV